VVDDLAGAANVPDVVEAPVPVVELAEPEPCACVVRPAPARVVDVVDSTDGMVVSSWLQAAARTQVNNAAAPHRPRRTDCGRTTAVLSTAAPNCGRRPLPSRPSPCRHPYTDRGVCGRTRSAGPRSVAEAGPHTGSDRGAATLRDLLLPVAAHRRHSLPRGRFGTDTAGKTDSAAETDTAGQTGRSAQAREAVPSAGSSVIDSPTREGPRAGQ
jgi:hypothetical protein